MPGEVVSFGGAEDDDPKPRKTRSDKDLNKQDTRTRAVIVMRAEGASYQEIADVLEFSGPADAKHAFMDAISKAYDPDDAKTLRGLQGARLDMLLRSTWPKATDPDNPNHLMYNRRAHEIIAEISKLYGVNAPAVLQMLNPDADKLDEVVAHILAIQNGDEDLEGDIIALVEDEEGAFAEEGAEDGES